MSSVGLNIDDVVETIDGRRRKAERHPRDGTCAELIDIEDGSTEEDGDEDEEVFDPLAYTYDAQGTDNFSSHSLRSLITTFNN